MRIPIPVDYWYSVYANASSRHVLQRITLDAMLDPLTVTGEFGQAREFNTRTGYMGMLDYTVYLSSHAICTDRNLGTRGAP